MRYKEFHGAFTVQEILGTRDIIDNYLIPATGSNVVPQVEGEDGVWLQDTSEIIDVLETRHPQAVVVPSSPRQRLACYLIELLADEWMLPWAFWERWHYSLAGVEPNQEAYNAQQWGAIIAPGATGLQRREAGRARFRDGMKIDAPETAQFGPFAGLPQLGVTDKTEAAWTESMCHMLSILDAHFDSHDYVLGGRPSLADFALLGPLYPHLYKDPVPGFMMRSEFPLLCEWIERCNGSLEGGARGYRQTAYKVEDGKLVPVEDATDGGEWLADDEIPDSLLPLLGVFFDEMWPVLKSSIAILRDYIASDAYAAGKPLPFKSFYSPPGFDQLQSKGGALSHEFEIRGVREWRMVSPYQIWMLGRLSDAMQNETNDENMMSLLAKFKDGQDLLTLQAHLKGCRLQKEFERLYAAD
jgi:glutathione S-transferase